MPDSSAGLGCASILRPLGYQTSPCGYCKGHETDASYYVKAKSLDVEHYQALIDRGWRRSGTLLYKPDVRRACCPHYTIRLPVAAFVPSSDKRKAVNRWNSFVLGDAYISDVQKMHPKSRREKIQLQNGFDLGQVIHAAEYERVKRPPEPAHRFEVTLEPDVFTEEKFQLFSDYQQTVHDDKVTRLGFRRFLCNSPLQRCMLDGARVSLGSVHQCYRLDGRLIAMAVLDLLPHAVSGVYFIYHSDFGKFSLGKVSALREATLAKENGLEFYYMGYYIHNCHKMRYKAEYRPQYLLDPESYQWDEFDSGLRELLDERQYVSLSRRRGCSQSSDPPGGGRHTTAHDAAIESDFGGKFPCSPVRARAAVDGGLSLMELGMPGVLKVHELLKNVQLEQIRAQMPSITGQVSTLENFTTWNQGSVLDNRSLKGVIAEMAACVGPDVAKEMIVLLED